MRQRALILLLAGVVAAAVPLAARDTGSNEPMTLETCAMCHDDVAAAFVRGPHGRAMAKVSKEILARSCVSCHQLEAAQFRRPYAHRKGAQKPFECTACHDPHGQSRRGRMTLLGNGGVCIECHTEKAGPFVYPHPPREVNGCVTCHEPHGSMNPRQLKRHSVMNLCLECHADVPAFHDLSQARYRACQTCHVAVHGSNRDPRLLAE